MARIQALQGTRLKGFFLDTKPNDRHLCPVCLRIYKKSKEGKYQRQLKRLGGDCSWGKGRWPADVYHTGTGRLCSRHRSRTNAKMRRTYEDRNVHVWALGFKSYTDYRASELWKSIRTRCFATFGNVCHFCEAPAVSVHHGQYDADTIQGKSLEHLYPVCRACHEGGEFFQDGDKCSPRVATHRMRKLAFERGYGMALRRREAARSQAIHQLRMKAREATAV